MGGSIRTLLLVDRAAFRPPATSKVLWTAPKWAPHARELAAYIASAFERLLTHADNHPCCSVHFSLRFFDSVNSAAEISASPLTPVTNSSVRAARSETLRQALAVDVDPAPNTGTKEQVFFDVLQDALGLLDSSTSSSVDSFYDTDSAKSPQCAERHDSTPIIYIFSHAPATRRTLASFTGSSATDIPSLDESLINCRLFRSAFCKMREEHVRMVWVNSFSRRIESKSSYNLPIENIFQRWWLMQSPCFRFINLFSILLDRRIVPAHSIIDALRAPQQAETLKDTKHHLKTNRDEVEVFFQDEASPGKMSLMRYFFCQLSNLQDATLSDKASSVAGKTRIVMLIKGYLDSPLPDDVLHGMTDNNTPPQLMRPKTTPDDRKTNYSASPSLFSGLMVNLARTTSYIVADVFETNSEIASFNRYSVLLQPVTPLLALVRKFSHSYLNYIPCDLTLPESYNEWIKWHEGGRATDLELYKPLAEVSAKFFETYLPDVWPSHASTKNMGVDEPIDPRMHGDESPALKDLLEELATSPNNDEMTMSIEQLKSAHASSKTTPSSRLMHSLRNLVDSSVKEQEDLETQEAEGNRIMMTLKTRLEAQVKAECVTPSPHRCNFKTWSPSSKLTSRKIKKLEKERHRAHFRKLQSNSDALEVSKTLSFVQMSSDCPQNASPLMDSTPARAISKTTHRDKFMYSSCEESAKQNISSLGNQVKRSIFGNKEYEATSGGISNTVCSADFRLDNTPALLNGSDAMLGTSQGIPQIHSLIIDGPVQKVSQEAEMSRKVQPEQNLKKDDKDSDSRNAIERCGDQFGRTLDKLAVAKSKTVALVVQQALSQLTLLAEAFKENSLSKSALKKIVKKYSKPEETITSSLQGAQNQLQSQNKSSGGTLSGHAWAAILGAYEQVVWQLLIVTYLVELERKDGRCHSSSRYLKRANIILSCVQVTGEFSAISSQSTTMFHNTFSYFFSSVLWNFAEMPYADEEGSWVANLFEQYEQRPPLPVSNNYIGSIPGCVSATDNYSVQASPRSSGCAWKHNTPSETPSILSHHRKRISSNSYTPEPYTKRRRSMKPKDVIAAARNKKLELGVVRRSDIRYV